MNPILNPIDAFDVSEGTTITFLCENQIYGSKVSIYDPQTKKTVADLDIQKSMELQYRIPPHTLGLENGKQYEMVVTIYEDYSYSSFHAYHSNSRLFYCCKRPSFSIFPITGTSDFYTLENSSISLSISYPRDNEDTLDMYYIKFYDEYQRELSDSGERYGPDGIENAFFVNGLRNKTFYYFRAFGRTKHGMKLDTGFRKVYTSFLACESSSNLHLKNHCHTGEITGEVYLNVILYSSEKPVRFEDNTIADLKDNTLTYYSGLRMGQRFSMYTKVRDLCPDSCFLKLTDHYGNPVRFCYNIYREYDVKHTAGGDGAALENSIPAIVRCYPYFSIEIGAQRYITKFFSPAASLAGLSEKQYTIAMSKCRDIINLNIKEIT